jgi:hypothetical protein
MRYAFWNGNQTTSLVVTTKQQGADDEKDAIGDDCILAASGAAFAQPSQGQGGAQAGVNGNGPNAPDSAMQNDVRPSATTGMGK